MAGRQVFNPDGFKNIEEGGRTVGYEFQFKAQYYRGVTLSIVRDIQVTVDGVQEPRESLRFTVNGETFTLDEMTTVVDSDYRWEFGEYATVSVLRDGGLAKGSHHIAAYQKIVPSYMPFPMEMTNETEFEMN